MKLVSAKEQSQPSTSQLWWVCLTRPGRSEQNICSPLVRPGDITAPDYRNTETHGARLKAPQSWSVSSTFLSTDTAMINHVVFKEQPADALSC